MFLRTRDFCRYKRLFDHDKIPANIRSQVEPKIAQVKTALQGKDVETTKRAMQELNAAMQQIGSAIYGQPGSGPQQPPPDEQQPPPGGQQPPPEGTVEGEFREV